ncbi:MAG: hypothetical protein IT530_04080 [Burkholderiales bacterium]|nr:hypothetical protein [Burkholderiales bacterium]
MADRIIGGRFQGRCAAFESASHFISRRSQVNTRFDFAAAQPEPLIHAEYPIEQLVRCKTTRFQLGFARMAMHLLPHFRHTVMNVSDKGLVILAASEMALALPGEVIRQIYADDADIGAPEVRLVYGDTVQEPIMWVRASVPRAHTESVVHGLITRKAEIEEVDWFAPSPVVRATAPLRELLGYPDALAALCGSKAELQMWLSHYAPVPPGPGIAA